MGEFIMNNEPRGYIIAMCMIASRAAGRFLEEISLEGGLSSILHTPLIERPGRYHRAL